MTPEEDDKPPTCGIHGTVVFNKRCADCDGTRGNAQIDRWVGVAIELLANSEILANDVTEDELAYIRAVLKEIIEITS
jgi:hypothetical protein